MPGLQFANQGAPTTALVETVNATRLVVRRDGEDDPIEARQSDPRDCVLDQPCADPADAPSLVYLQLRQLGPAA